MKPASFIYSSPSNPKVILQSQNIWGSGVNRIKSVMKRCGRLTIFSVNRKKQKKKIPDAKFLSLSPFLSFWIISSSFDIRSGVFFHNDQPIYYRNTADKYKTVQGWSISTRSMLQSHSLSSSSSAGSSRLQMAADRQFSKRPKCPFPLKEVLWHEARSSQEFGSEQFLFSSASFLIF